MILDIYKDSLEYSAKDLKTLLILGATYFLSFLFLPIFLIYGYSYRVTKISVEGMINGNDPLPEFDNVIDMFVDGVKVVIVQIAYLLVPCIIFLIFALIGYFTKLDLTKIGTYLFMILLGVIICSLINMFVGSETFDLGITIVSFSIGLISTFTPSFIIQSI